MDMTPSMKVWMFFFSTVVIWRVSGLNTHTLSCNKRRTSCSAALYSASLPRIGRRAMFDNWTRGHHTSPHSYPTLRGHFIIGWLNSLKPQGVLIIMNLSRLIKQSKRNNNSDTIHLSAVTACHCYLWPQFLPPTSPNYRSLTTFQTPNQFRYIEVPSPSPWRWMCPTWVNWWQWG